MSKNPLINAFLAALYIVVVASVMYYGQKYGGPTDSIIAPIAMLSLFVLSAAVMGFLFLSQPAQLYLNGEKGESVGLFLKTVIAFACITAVFIIILFFVSTGR